MTRRAAMSKPIDGAHIFNGICPNTEPVLTLTFPARVFAYGCSKYPSNWCAEPCTVADWKQCPFNPAGRIAVKKEKPPASGYVGDIENLEFENRNKFYYGCQHYLKKLKKDVDPLILGLNLDDPAERKQAWEKVLEKFKVIPPDPGIEVNGR
jgi:hypothetical protein